ncbi:MAG: helix-turn-helix domain-containing protein, partial [Traorella sp.]
MNIGNKIKTLRNKKALSQSELADILHVTAQAVSKWESNLSYPDINQLPTLASLFGITIDELFEYPSDLEYERIDHMIENGKALSNEFFDHSEEFLLNEIKNDPKNYRAISTLADLYHFHACRLNDKAVHY